MTIKYEVLLNNPDGNEYVGGFYREGTEVRPEDVPRSVRNLVEPLKKLLDGFKDSPRQVSFKVSI